MAVKPELIRAAIRKLFPSANLSTTRMDAIADRLSKKPKDDATEADIEELVTDYNSGAMTFEEIAKHDDKLRTLEAKPKDVKTDPPKTVDPNPETDPMKIMMANLTALSAEIKGLKEDKTKETVSKTRKETASERFKNFPDKIKNDLLSDIDSMNFNDEDSFNSFIDRKESAFKVVVEQLKLAGFDGSDNPPTSTGGADAKKGTVKALTAEQTKGIADSI